MDRKILSFVLLTVFLAGISAACNGGEIPPAPVVTPPAMSVDITADDCPSVEVRAGMQVAWTNRDDVDRTIFFERKDANGAIIDSGGVDLLQPGSMFAMTMTEPGRYTYYCSEDRSKFGAITVLP